MAEWQKIGGIEVCEGTDGVVGFVFGQGTLLVFQVDGVSWVFANRDLAKLHFESQHCQPRHRLIECADGAVMVLSVDEVDGKPRRGAGVSKTVGTRWGIRTVGLSDFHNTKDEAIAAAVAYVTAR